LLLTAELCLYLIKQIDSAQQNQSRQKKVVKKAKKKRFEKQNAKVMTTAAGFEPTREFPRRFLVFHLLWSLFTAITTRSDSQVCIFVTAIQTRFFIIHFF
jgi:hypothetical protein